MDVLAHFLWTWIIFFRTKYVRKALLISFMPDILSWGIFMIYRIITKAPFGPPHLNLIPDWVWLLYGMTHSIIIFALVFFVVWKISKKVPVYLYTWIIHIAIDIPTHTREFLGTPSLWPISNWLFPGISWGTPTFMVANYTIIIALLTISLVKKKNLLIEFYKMVKKK